MLRITLHGLPAAIDQSWISFVTHGEAVPSVEEHHEQQAQADAGDDVRVHHGNVVHGHQPGARHSSVRPAVEKQPYQDWLQGSGTMKREKLPLAE